MTSEDIYNDKQFINYCKKIAGGFGDDLFMETLIIYMEKPCTHENPAGYFKKIAWRIWALDRSNFNKKHRPKRIEYQTLINASDDSPNEMHVSKLKIMNELLEQPPKNKRDRFMKEIFREYLQVGSYRLISDSTGISYSVICKTVIKFKTKLDDIYKDSLN